MIRRPGLGSLVAVVLLAGCGRSSPSAPAPAPVATTAAVAPAAPPAPVTAPATERRPPLAVSHGTLKGATVWPSVANGDYNLKLQILLVGDDPFTKGEMARTTTHLGQPYSVWLPAGAYRLMAQVGPVRLWDTRVIVMPDQETAHDLTPDTSPVSPSEFPLHEDP